MLACRTHPLFLSLLATYTVPPFSDYAIPRLRTRPCNVEYESTPSRLDSLMNNMVHPFGTYVKARARSTWHTDRHTSSLQHLVHDLVSTMQPREPASLLKESCGLPSRNGDVEEGKCLHAQVIPKFTIVSLSRGRGQVVQIIL